MQIPGDPETLATGHCLWTSHSPLPVESPQLVAVDILVDFPGTGTHTAHVVVNSRIHASATGEESVRIQVPVFAEGMEALQVQSCAIDLSSAAIVEHDLRVELLGPMGWDLGEVHCLIEKARLALDAERLNGEKGWPNADGLLRCISNRVASGGGWSLVRLGDGEGRVLADDQWISDQVLLSDVVNYQFGPVFEERLRRATQCSPERGVCEPGFKIFLKWLRARLWESLHSADAVGLPLEDSLVDTRGESLSSQDRTTKDLGGQVGLGFAVLTALTSGLSPTCGWVGTYALQTWAQEGFFETLLAENGRPLVVVGSRDIVDSLSESFGLRARPTWIRTPAHATWSGHGSDHIMHSFPNWQRTFDEVARIESSLILLGCGLMGKAMVAAAKSRGNVVIDIGAMFDAWGGSGLPYATDLTNLRLAGR